MLVEVDDASIAEVGNWPWDKDDLRRLFEGPWPAAAGVVSAVDPVDFSASPESSEVFWKGLAGLGAVAAAAPCPADEPTIDAVAALGPHPAGGQGELIRSSNLRYDVVVSNLPRWRTLVVKAIAARYSRQYPQATAEEFLDRMLSPYWRNSGDVRRLLAFWFSQARSREVFEAAAGVVDVDRTLLPQLAVMESAYLPPPEVLQKRPTGFIGPVAGASARGPAREPAFVVFGDKAMPRLAIAAASTLEALGAPAFEGRSLIFNRPGGAPWRAGLDSAGRLIVNWTGNGRVGWDARFRRVPAALLIESANARRALWQAYSAYEKPFGEHALADAVASYEKASESVDFAGMARAEKAVNAATRTLAARLSAKNPSAPADVRAARENIMTLDADYVLLEDAMRGAFLYRLVVLSAGTTGRGAVETPWGAKVPPAALEVAILNSILTGETVVTAAPRWWWATACVLGFTTALIASQFGVLAVAIPATVVTVAAAFGWYSLFNSYGILLGFSAVTAAPCGLVAGSVCHYAFVGRHLREWRLILRHRVAKKWIRTDLESVVLRQVDEAAVLAVDIVAQGPAQTAAVGRFERVIAGSITDMDGIMLDAGAYIEGAYGWLGSAAPMDSAVTAALSSRQRLKVLVDKLASEGAGAMQLRMAVGGGRGVLSLGRVARRTLIGSGEAFDRADEAARATQRWQAGLVVTKADAPKCAASYELRRLDARGDYYEVMERKGALSITMRRVRENYEQALGTLAAGNAEAAAALLRRNLEQHDDGPSRVLLGEIGARSGEA